MSSNKPDFTREKLKAISNFSARIIHDLNNISTIIINVCEALKEDLENNPDASSKITMLEEAGTRLLDYAAELRSFCLKKDSNKQSCRVNKIIEEMAAKISDPRIYVLCDPNQPVARISEEHFVFIVNELVKNAIEASSKKPIIYVETKLKNGVVSIQVRDHGKGMSKEQLSHLCEPYFSSKAHIKGAGTSLAKMYFWINNNGGTINFSSVEGAGTVVNIVLAQAESDALERSTPIEILLVEEQESLRKIAKEILTTDGSKILHGNSNKLK